MPSDLSGCDHAALHLRVTLDRSGGFFDVDRHI